MRGRRAIAGLASLVVAAGVLAAVVPVSAGADTPSQQFPPVDQPGVTETEINVGGVVSKTNPLGGDYASAFDGVQAYFDMVNASKDKGIYGRKLNLSSKRDDQLGMNRQEVQGLISEDNVFAVLPVAVLLFTGADLLGQSGIPTFGWNINAEWGSEQAAGPPNLFGEKGSFLCFTCPSAALPWLAQKLKAKKVGLLAYKVPQSADCAEGSAGDVRQVPGVEDRVHRHQPRLRRDRPQQRRLADEGQGRRSGHDVHGQQRSPDAGQRDEEAGDGRRPVPAERVQPEVHRGERPVLRGLVRADILHAVRGEAEAEGPQGLPEVDEEGRLRAERELDGGLDQRRPVRDGAQGGGPGLHPPEGHRRDQRG